MVPIPTLESVWIPAAVVTNWEDPPPVAVTVTTPTEIGDTIKLSPKSIVVTAVPTNTPESFIITPLPTAVRPVRALPSIAGRVPTSCAAGRLVSSEPDPENVVAVTIPINLPSPVTVSLLVGFVVPIPTFLSVWIPTDVDVLVPPIEVKVVALPKRL